MKFLRQSSKGFTLVELLMYMGIVSILLLALTNVFSQVVDSRIESEATSAVEQDGSYLLARLFYDISRAQSVSQPSSLGSSASALQMSINSINYSYTVNNGALELTNNNGTDRLNNSETTISGFSVTRIGNSTGKPTLQVSFTVNSRAVRAGGPETRSYQTTVSLR